MRCRITIYKGPSIRDGVVLQVQKSFPCVDDAKIYAWDLCSERGLSFSIQELRHQEKA